MVFFHVNSMDCLSTPAVTKRFFRDFQDAMKRDPMPLLKADETQPMQIDHSNYNTRTARHL
jgi:hypothetical protein